MRARSAAIGFCATIAVFALASPVLAAQTFPDPFGGEGIHSDIRAGSNGNDIGDAFFFREDAVLSIRLFLDAPNSFIESHVCLSAEPFTRRLAPGQCQFQATGVAAGTFDITLPPDSFPLGAVPFDDPLGAFCAQVHVKYSAPGLALTRLGGGSAFAGWESGIPFFGSVCFPSVPDPEPPGEGTAEVTKTGALVAGDVVFTVTVSNPTTFLAPDVVVWDTLPPTLTWTLPPECVLGPSCDGIARCAIGDLPAGVSIDLVFSATPAAGECGEFSNNASTFLGRAVASSVSYASVDVPCPPEPDPDPLILFTKEPSATELTAPGTITYIVTFENAGPGPATSVTVTDELPPGPDWSIGSGSNVCSITGKTLTCFAETVPDGVFEVLEITGTVDATDCGTMDNEGTVEFEGGPEPGSVTAISDPVEVTGCGGVAPSEITAPSPTEAGGAGGVGGGDDGELPDTATGTSPPIAALALGAAFLVAISVLILRTRRRT